LPETDEVFAQIKKGDPAFDVIMEDLKPLCAAWSNKARGILRQPNRPTEKVRLPEEEAALLGTSMLPQLCGSDLAKTMRTIQSRRRIGSKLPRQS
jgi:hypothetical protein